MRLTCVLLMSSMLAFAVGCSFSKSSGSISDSISSPFKSSSRSSSPDDKAEPEAPQDTASYADDVSHLALTYAKNGGDIGAFRSAVSKLATNRGVTNWEVDSTTCTAIGSGLAKGGMSEAAFSEFSKELFGDDLNKQAAVRKGYQASAPAPPAEP